MRTSRSLRAALGLCVAMVSCGGETTKPRFSDVAGIYRLQVPQGGTTPVRVGPQSASTMNVVEGTLDLQPVWYFKVNYRDAATGTGLSGTYRRTADGIVLTYNGGVQESGTLSGDVLTIPTSYGTTLVFNKIGS